jgi:hypothetical protein
MELYQRVVLGLAIVLLIAAYIMIYFTLVDNNKNWPPSVAKCPDYWVYNATSDMCESINDFNVGTSDSKYPDVDGETLTQKSTCDKYKWAKEKEVSWEGLSYGVSMDCY